jgi:hypothetical protein
MRLQSRNVGCENPNPQVLQCLNVSACRLLIKSGTPGDQSFRSQKVTEIDRAFVAKVNRCVRMFCRDRINLFWRV